MRRRLCRVCIVAMLHIMLRERERTSTQKEEAPRSSYHGSLLDMYMIWKCMVLHQAWRRQWTRSGCIIHATPTMMHVLAWMTEPLIEEDWHHSSGKPPLLRHW
jgi:hypothetical protein